MPEPQHPGGLAPSLVEDLHTLAIEAAHRSYSPYSHFRVGAALLIQLPDQPDPILVSGCNVENASYRLTTCAEQSAIAAAVSTYGPAIRLLAVTVVNLNQSPSMPCGACRQTILEFCDPETTWITYPSNTGSEASATLATLLPDSFRLPQS